jgi:tRNA pseudouridine38-40 synthase
VAFASACISAFAHNIAVTVAGRTDAGVHAKGQVAHFDLDYKMSNGQDKALSGFELAKAINFYLSPQPIAVIDAQIVGNDFHARFHAKNKLYTYRIMNRPYNLTLDSGFAWWKKTPLDIKAMNKAAKILTGEHDFTTFRDSECQAKSPVRCVDKFWLEVSEILSGKEILIHVEGQAFLHHQVRNMVGTLSLVGEGKWTPEDVQTALEARDRKAGGPTAPSDGLYLMRVDYDHNNNKV